MHDQPWVAPEFKNIINIIVPDDFRSKLHLVQIDDLDYHTIANLINNAFLEPMKAYQPLQSLPSFDGEFNPPPPRCLN